MFQWEIVAAVSSENYRASREYTILAVLPLIVCCVYTSLSYKNDRKTSFVKGLAPKLTENLS